MDRTAAEQIVRKLEHAANDILETIDLVKANAAEPHFTAYSKAVGELMFVIDGILRPFFVDYPDLRPTA